MANLTCLDLPPASAPDLGLSGAEPKYRPPEVEPPDILVVDDRAENLLAMEAALADLGCRLVKVPSGREALRCLLAQDFALILLDVQMPTLNGIETARLIRQRERSRHTPIIFITAYQSNDAEIREAYRLGAVDFLFKPVRMEILQAKASVFVALQRRTQESIRQAALLRDHERAAHVRELAEQRQLLEREGLRRRLEEQKQHAQELASKAEALRRTIAQLERTQTELQRSNDKLAEADRRKDEFLATLAHELRNPLAPIMAGLELLELPDISEAQRTQARAAMRRQAEHLVRLVEDLLDISRITSGKIELRRQLLDMRDIAPQAVSIAQPVIEKRQHRLKLELGDVALPVHGDAVRLTQVVANLLNNAARYTDPGGNIELRCLRQVGEVIVRVTDDGQGIAPELLGRIFDMFVQQRAGGGGLGVGLTLVRNLVEMHGGGVDVRSPGVGCGSTFEIRLPLRDGEDRSASPSAAGIEAVDPQPLRIVIVDDHEDIRLTLRQMLEGWGHTVSVASASEEGIAMVLRERPDVALVDIGLPDLPGYEVARQVRAALSEQAPRLIALTGFNQREDRERARASGFDDHLAKPATGATLRRALSRC